MRLLVAYDGSYPSKKALRRAIEMAKSSEGELILLTVTEPVCPLGITEEDCGKLDEILRKQTGEILKGVEQDLKSEPFEVKSVVKTGNAADEIVKYAEQENINTIVIGSHGRHGAGKFFLGSVSARVANLSPCSVIIVK